MKRIPTLDGWRGIAILLVLIDHIQSQWLKHYFWPPLQTGQHGVTIFFILSGLLITNSLLKSSNLTDFYIRRFFRLLPVAWSYLLFLTIVGLAFHQYNAIRPLENIGCLFFFRNYVPTQNFLASGHYWSLSIEEQFYLVWPIILLVCGKRSARWILGTNAGIIAVFRIMHWSNYDRIWMAFHTEVRADALCIGCLLALALEDQRIQKFFSYASNFLVPICAGVSCICIYYFHWLPPLLESISIAGLIGCTLITPQTFISRICAFRPLTHLGLISYSLYVWQQFFLQPFDRNARIFLMLLLPFFVFGSYFFIEKPCIRLGHRLSTKLRSLDNQGAEKVA